MLSERCGVTICASSATSLASGRFGISRMRIEALISAPFAVRRNASTESAGGSGVGGYDLPGGRGRRRRLPHPDLPHAILDALLQGLGAPQDQPQSEDMDEQNFPVHGVRVE